MENAPVIYKFHSYREYLFEAYKSTAAKRNLSLRALAKQSGVSHGYLPLVYKGERNLTLKHLPQIAKTLGLKSHEIVFLKNLIILEDSRDPDLQRQAILNLSKNRNFAKFQPEEFKTYKYMAHWHFVAIREMVTIGNFKDDPRWIRSQFLYPIKLSEIETALDFLKSTNLIFQNPQGQWEATHANFRGIGGIFQLVLRSFHEQMLQLSTLALQKVSKNFRKQIGYTAALNQEDFQQVKSILEEAKQKIQEIEAHSKGGDVIYHVNLSAFPLTQSSLDTNIQSEE